MKKLTEAQIDQLVAWREQGRSFRWIAYRLGVSKAAVHYQALKHGAVSPRQIGRAGHVGPASFVGKDGRVFRRFTPAEDAEMRRLAGEGKQAAAIAALIGRPNTSVRMRLLMLGQHEDIAEMAA